MIGLIKGTARQAKTVSGLPLPIASYKSNSKSPIQELSLSINPTQSGSGDPAPDNIRPITGVSSVNVTRTGKNLVEFPISSNWGNYYISSTGQAIASSSTTKEKSYADIYVEPNTNYTLYTQLGVESQPWVAISEYTENDTFIRRNTNGAGYSSITITTGATTKKLTVSMRTYDNVLIACLYDTGNTYTIALGDTYYGATLDVVSGKLSVTHKQGDLGDYSYTKYSNKLFYANPTDKKNNTDIMCDSLKFAGNFENATGANSMSNGQIGGFANAESSNHWLYVCVSGDMTATALKEYVTGMKVVFELATPIEIDLTPTQINSLLGQNHIWHDGNGDVEVLKFMDRQLYFGR